MQKIKDLDEKLDRYLESQPIDHQSASIRPTVSEMPSIALSSGGSRISQRGRQLLRGPPTYYLTNFSPTQHENE